MAASKRLEAPSVATMLPQYWPSKTLRRTSLGEVEFAARTWNVGNVRCPLTALTALRSAEPAWISLRCQFKQGMTGSCQNAAHDLSGGA